MVHPVIRLLLAAFLGAVLVPAAQAEGYTHRVDDFRDAKDLLMERVYNNAGSRRTLYCGCLFDSNKVVDHGSCMGAVREDVPWANRRNRVEFEHATPASYSQHFRCYREPKVSEGGQRPNDESPRRYCRRVSETFNAMEADSHNLFPAVGSINAVRGARAYAMIPGEAREYGACDFEAYEGQAEPRPEVRGDVARAVLYMSAQYKIRLSRKNVQLYQAWDRMDPPDQFENWRNREIEKYQGNDNPFITRHARAR